MERIKGRQTHTLCAALKPMRRGGKVDRDLVVRAQHGDHEAFSQLVAVVVGWMYDTARLILHSDDRAQDAVQDALLQAWLNIRGLRDPARFDAWLRRLLVHACYRAAKHDRVRATAEVKPLIADEPSVPDGIRAIALRDELARGFRHLSPEQRAVLVLHFYLDLPDAEAADALGIPVGTLKSRLNRATSALRSALSAEERRIGPVEERTA
jgi:RNA polymerase sigma-70 factor (ECF subfamily)